MLDGDEFEARSESLLRDYGMTILARQYRCRLGEIDLIAHDEHRLLFVEVRARRHRDFGGAAASVNRAKQCKLKRCAAFYLSQHPQWRHLPCRFDVIAWEPRGNLHGRAHAGHRSRALGDPHGDSHDHGTRHRDSSAMEARWIQSAFLA